MAETFKGVENSKRREQWITKKSPLNVGDIYGDYLSQEIEEYIYAFSYAIMKRQAEEAIRRRTRAGWDWIHAEMRFLPFCPRLKRLIPVKGFNIPDVETNDRTVLDDWFVVFCHSGSWCHICLETYASPEYLGQPTHHEHFEYYYSA